MDQILKRLKQKLQGAKINISIFQALKPINICLLGLKLLLMETRANRKPNTFLIVKKQLKPR